MFSTSIMMFILCFYLVSSQDYVELVTFDGSFQWKLTNDPVMGGRSNSTWDVNKTDKIAHWVGDCKIVPSLQAPGFCNVDTANPYTSKFNDASGFSHLEISLRSRVDYKGFKISFAANTLNPQFKCFKADFVAISDGAWHTYAIPFNSFSNEWSPATGEPTKTCAEHPEVCPTDDDLKKIQQVGFWMEGSEGHFDVDIQWVRAGHGNSSHTCRGNVQQNLRWGVSKLEWAGNQSMADAICCDSTDAGLAEPRGLFQGLKLFESLNQDKLNTFYDSVGGEPLFIAPKGRTFAQWRNESIEHGWPSFRDEEVVPGSIRVNENGWVYSKSTNTRLGDNLPDNSGNRYCLDTVCLSGRPN